MKQNKLEFLEGIRGIMALNVMVNHFIDVYYPQMNYQEFAESAGGFLSLFATTPLSIFVNGDIAVRYFFVLTGFLVARSFLIGRGPTREQLPGKFAKRYFRLLPMVVAATFFTWVTMKLGWQCHFAIAEKVPNVHLLRSHGGFEPTWKRFYMNAFYEPFMLGSSDFVRLFWTIGYELWGYILCMITCHIFEDSRYRRLGYTIAALLIWFSTDGNYTGFFMGAFVADLCYRKEKDTTVLSKYYASWLYSKPVIIIAFILGAYLAACTTWFTGVYLKFGSVGTITPEIVRVTGVSLLLFALMETPKAAKLFEAKWMLTVGKMSFSIYAFHWPLMLSLQAALFNRFYDMMSYDRAALASLALTLPVIFLVSWCVHLLLDRKWNWKGILNKVRR